MTNSHKKFSVQLVLLIIIYQTHNYMCNNNIKFSFHYIFIQQNLDLRTVTLKVQVDTLVFIWTLLCGPELGSFLIMNKKI